MRDDIERLTAAGCNLGTEHGNIYGKNKNTAIILTLFP